MVPSSPEGRRLFSARARTGRILERLPTALTKPSDAARRTKGTLTADAPEVARLLDMLP